VSEQKEGKGREGECAHDFFELSLGDVVPPRPLFDVSFIFFGDYFLQLFLPAHPARNPEPRRFLL
jgi:hypothetical protein